MKIFQVTKITMWRCHKITTIKTQPLKTIIFQIQTPTQTPKLNLPKTNHTHKTPLKTLISKHPHLHTNSQQQTSTKKNNTTKPKSSPDRSSRSWTNSQWKNSTSFPKNYFYWTLMRNSTLSCWWRWFLRKRSSSIILSGCTWGCAR